MNNQKLTNEAMLEEAKAFQREVTRGKDHRSHGGTSSPRSGAYGSGAHTAGGTPRGVSRQPAAQNLATPEQFFGRQGHPSPAAPPPRNPTMPAAQQPVSRPVDNYEPMQVDPNPVVPKIHNEAPPTPGRKLASSRWATSAPPSNPPPQSMPSPQSMPPSFTVPVAPASASIGTGRAGLTTDKALTFSSSQNTTLDTPEMPKISKGLLGSKWAAKTSPASPSPLAMKYPDPSTLEPVYRSDDWLSDYKKELSIKTKNTSENQPTRQTPPTQPTGVQSACETVKTPTSESRQPGQNLTNLSAASPKRNTMQAAAHTVAPKQASDNKSGPSAEFGRTPPSVPAASNQGGVFNDSAFKNWYNSQFMRRKA